MIDLAWLRDVLLFVPAVVTAWRLSLARGYQIRAAGLFRSLPAAQKARLNSAGEDDADWSELSEDARKVRDLRDKATTLTTFARLLPTWCLASLCAGLALQAWLVLAAALAVDGVPAPPE